MYTFEFDNGLIAKKLKIKLQAIIRPPFYKYEEHTSVNGELINTF